MRNLQSKDYKAVLTDWVKDCKTEEEKKVRLGKLVSAMEMFEVLDKVIEQKHSAVTASFIDYDIPSWSHKAADTIGYQRALEEIHNMIQSINAIDPRKKPKE